MSPLDRRRFLRGAGAAAAVGVAGFVGTEILQGSASAAVIEPTFNINPFQFGVASSPLRNVIWTRLAILPLARDGRAGMPDGDIPVRWKVARNRDGSGVLAEGTAYALSGNGHSARVEVAALPQATAVFYWFEYGNWRSTVGRLKTAPAANSNPSAMTAAVISCANFEHGFFHCYEHIADHEVDVVIATGDFTYADSYNPGYGSKARSHLPAGECFTLADYRLRHSQYRADPQEQAMRASAGMVLTLDDHEVDDDWAGSTPDYLEDAAANSGPGTFWERRHNALQAHWENTPLPFMMRPVRSLMPNSYQTLNWGRLADLHLLDTRQFRSRQDKGRRFEENRYMLGPDQLAALGDSYRGARWDLLVNQVVMAGWTHGGPGTEKASDSWDGYRAERRRVIRQWSDRRVANPVVLTGDVHFGGADSVFDDFDGLSTKAPEIISSSITSGGDLEGDWAGSRVVLDALPLHMYHRRRGWTKLDITSQRIHIQWRGTEVVSARAAQPDRIFQSADISAGQHDFSNTSW
ncbi:hypothetical protein FEF34_02055 [Streptomyces marianii]|uniref:Twin-arginine translocation signal domain-containing protein n=1 Tax=Streptomyces marianii TaxID=1817406 RepID=A0A5R9DZD0_9ACTN|nr:hypothetical protein FEF34_02055 [Streptomyces marianii]